ncbi:protein rep [Staphylococcus aureus]
MLSYGGLLKEKHKNLNLDDAEDGNTSIQVMKIKRQTKKKKHIRLQQFGISKSKIII